MKSQIPAVALASATLLFGISVATAQVVAPPSSSSAPRAAPQPLKNLQVFPKDISRAELISNMRFFSQSLGVRCTFCHVGVEGQPPSTFDFAADTKKEKLIARKMLVMVQRINTQDFGVQPGMANAKVTCFTCHRGSSHPLTVPPAAVPAAAVPAAAPPAVAPPIVAAPAHKAERGST